jgi:hypothetical protein
MIIQLNKMPAIWRSYKNLLLTSRKGIPAEGTLPELAIVLDHFSIDPNHLKEYKRLCRFSSDRIPLTYPYCLAGPLQLALAAHKDFPLKSAGLLHLRNHIVQHSQFDVNSEFSLKVQTAGSRFRPQGFEFDMLTIFEVKGQKVWSCTSTFLKRGKFDREDPQSANEGIFVKLDNVEDNNKIDVPRNIGRQYASLCKDYNPIHISVLLAKLFGFRRSIAHGMWVSAVALSHFEERELTSYDLAFKGPVFTGSQFSLVKAANGSDFNVFTGNNPKPVILAKVN